MNLPNFTLAIEANHFAYDYSERVTRATISLTPRGPIRYFGRYLDTSYCDITIQTDPWDPVHAVSGQDRGNFGILGKY